MAHVKAKRFPLVTLLPQLPPVVLKNYSIYLDPDEDPLERAKKFFGSDDKETLMRAMAEVLFGRHERGRSKGTTTWTFEAYVDLAHACAELYTKNPKLSDARIAKLLVETGRYKGVWNARTGD